MAIISPMSTTPCRSNAPVGATRHGLTERTRGTVDVSLREAEQPNRSADCERTLDGSQRELCAVQPEVDKHVPVHAGGGHRPAQNAERHDAAQRRKAASAANSIGHRSEPAAPAGDRPETEHRHELRRLPQVGLADLAAAWILMPNDAGGTPAAGSPT
jgi:hypothetical protein